MPVDWGWRIPSRVTDPRLRQTFQSLERYLIRTDNPDPDPPVPPDPPPDDPDPPIPDDPPPDPPPAPPPTTTPLTGSYGSLAVPGGSIVTMPSSPTTLGTREGAPLFTWDPGSRECTYLGPGPGGVGTAAATLLIEISTTWYTPQVEVPARTFKNKLAYNGTWVDWGSVTVASGATGGPVVTQGYLIPAVPPGTRFLFGVTQGSGTTGGVRYTLHTEYSISWYSA